MADNTYYTDYVLNPAGYIAGAAAVEEANASLEASMASVEAASTGPGGLLAAIAAVSAGFGAAVFSAGFLHGAITSLTPVVTGLGSALIGLSGLKLSQPFIDMATEVDNAERRFGAMLGSVKAGKAMMDWLRSYAVPSVLDMPALTALTASLVQGGQDPKRFLPVLETLALGGGGDPAQNGMELASIVRRLMGGQTADALGPEGLVRFGINRKMLEAAGARFNSGGHFQGTTDDALAMLETLTKTNSALKNLRAAFDDSPAVAFSTAMDSLNMALSKVGEVLTKFFLPPIKTASEYFRYLAESGIAEKIASSFASLFGATGAGGSGPSDLFLKGLVAVTTAIEILPSAIAKIKFVIVDMFNTVRSAVVSFVDFMSKMPVIGMMFQTAKVSIETLFNMGSTVGTDFVDMLGFMPAYEKNLSDFMSRRGIAAAAAGVSAGTTLAGGNATAPVVSHLAGIEANTKKLTLQFNDAIFGGSGLGLDSAELAGVSGRRTGGSRRDRARQHIERALSEISAMNLEKMGRALAR